VGGDAGAHRSSAQDGNFINPLHRSMTPGRRFRFVVADSEKKYSSRLTVSVIRDGGSKASSDFVIPTDRCHTEHYHSDRREESAVFL
jgi:hypothetical protein